jgi:hypothetical protein
MAWITWHASSQSHGDHLVELGSTYCATGPLVTPFREDLGHNKETPLVTDYILAKLGELISFTCTSVDSFHR